MSKVIVVSPHPDDEAIGCGGTLCKHSAQGDEIVAIFLTSGEKGGYGKTEAEIGSGREEEAREAAKILGISRVEFWKQPDGQLEANKICLEKLVEFISKFQPTIIYVTHPQEAHPDHQAAAMMVIHAVQSARKSIKKPAVWMYEIWTPVQQVDYIVDISAYVEQKRRAIQAHKSQCLMLKLDEAALGLNRYRGEMHNWIGGDYAEVFSSMKEL